MEHTKAQLQLLRFWLKNRLKPFVRIEPRISHLNVDFFKTKEINKILYDENLGLLHDNLNLKDILALKLPDNDLADFIKLHCPKLVKQSSNIEIPI